MKTTIILLLLAAILAGCSSISGVPERATNYKEELEALKPYFSPSVITTYQAKGTDAEKKTYRDEVIAARLRAIDLNFNEFIKSISAENKKLNIGTDTTVLVLGAAGAVSTVSSTQAILSATSATVTGVKSSIDKNAYYDSTLAALVSQMLASRKQVLVNIYLGMEKDVKDYSLMHGLLELENYFQAGTILGAVNEINKESGIQKSAAEEEIKNIIKGTYKKDSAGDTLRNFWKPDGSTINTTNETALKNWMSTNGVSASITLFLRAKHFSDARVKAVKDLQLE